MKSPCERIQWNCSGSEIEQESFRRIDREAPPALRQRFTDAEWHVARRLIHTTADFAIAEQLRFSPGAIEAALAALRRGARIYTDSNMIKSGLSIPKLPPTAAKRFSARWRTRRRRSTQNNAASPARSRRSNSTRKSSTERSSSAATRRSPSRGWFA